MTISSASTPATPKCTSIHHLPRHLQPPLQPPTANFSTGHHSSSVAIYRYHSERELNKSSHEANDSLLVASAVVCLSPTSSVKAARAPLPSLDLMISTVQFIQSDHLGLSPLIGINYSSAMSEERTKLFIGNLSYDTKDKDLEEVFEKYGRVKEARIAGKSEYV